MFYCSETIGFSGDRALLLPVAPSWRSGCDTHTGRDSRRSLKAHTRCAQRTASSRRGAAACGSPCRVARGLPQSLPSVGWRGLTALSSGTTRGGAPHKALHLCSPTELSAPSPWSFPEAESPDPDPATPSHAQVPAPRAATQVGHAGARLPLRLARCLPRALGVARPHPP